MASIARCLRAARPSRAFVAARPIIPFRTPRIAYTKLFSTSQSHSIRKYTKDHEWIDLNADMTSGVIGISEYAAEQLGDVVYVELPEEGRAVQQGDAIGAVESVKSASDINAPVACRIKEVNSLLEEKPGTINQVPEDDSHGGGWIARVEVDKDAAEQVEKLMDAEEYKTFTASDH